jgi:hypothetical protein
MDYSNKLKMIYSDGLENGSQQKMAYVKLAVDLTTTANIIKQIFSKEAQNLYLNRLIRVTLLFYQAK